MELHRTFIYEIVFTIFCVSIGVAVATYLSPKDNYFIGNFSFYWLPQAIVIGILFFARYKLPVICGVALIFSAYLACFHLWVFSQPHPESMAWLGYIFSFPGAAIGALASASIAKRFEIKNSVMLCVTALLITFVGLALNQALVCATVMYCSI
jgi:hypothetical protein